MADDIPSFMRQDQEDYQTKIQKIIDSGMRGYKILGRTRGLEVHINVKDKTIIVKDNDTLYLSIEYEKEFGGMTIDYIERYKDMRGLQWDIYELLMKKGVTKYVLTGGLLSNANLKAHDNFIKNGSDTLKISLVDERQPNKELEFTKANDILKGSTLQFKIELK